jgi:hypothetical protein
MARPLLPLLGMAAMACAPDVVIAQRDPTPAAAGSSTVGGSGGGGGSGGVPPGGTGGDLPNDGGGSGEGGERPTPAGPERLLADSVADFVLEQGQHGWSYGFDSGSLDSFQLMTRKGTIRDYEPPSKDMWDCWGNETGHWTQLFQLGAHSNGTETSTPANAILERAVRRWTSHVEADVVISGEAAKIDVVAGSNGVDVLVYVDGEEKLNRFIGGEDGGGISYKVKAHVKVGSRVDFVLDPHESDDHHDLSRFTGIVALDPASSLP